MTSPRPLRQVPLDRVTQVVFARIHKAMAPLRKDLAGIPQSAHLLAAAFATFRDFLPALDAAAYNAMRASIGPLCKDLQLAARVPLSATTRDLASQLLDHDLPRLAAIAVKLNEDEAPQFFAAIASGDSGFETFAVDTSQKTTIRKSDLETAIQSIVSARMADFQRLVQEDTAKWLSAQGFTDDTVTVEQDNGKTPYLIRRDLKAWRLVFAGREAVLKHERGILYVAYLLLNPPKEPIHAVDLATKIPDIYRKQLGLSSVTDPITGQTVPLEQHSRIQERNLGLEALQSAKAIWREQQKWESVLDDPNSTEPEKAEALRILDDIASFQRSHVSHHKDQAQRLVRALRRAITRFRDNLSAAVDPDGGPHPVLRDFAKHLDDHLLGPSAHASGRPHSRSRSGGAGRFIYIPPAGVTWKP